MAREKPGYEVFIQVAHEQLKPRPVEEFIDEAIKIKEEELRNCLRNY